MGASLECANLLALWYFYQSGAKAPHSKEASDVCGILIPV
jgi:hypothetical protein